MKLTKTLSTAALAAAMLLCPMGSQAAKPGDFTVGKGTFLLDGKPFVVKAAELHYPRIPKAYWDQRIKMCKALGMNTICMYVFWNIHEQKEGQFDFTGNNDIAAFVRQAQKNGMYVIVRPGPYVCAEWEMGGLPWWLLKKKDIKLRERDPYFMERVKIFEKKVAEQLALVVLEEGCGREVWTIDLQVCSTCCKLDAVPFGSFEARLLRLGGKLLVERLGFDAWSIARHPVS